MVSVLSFLSQHAIICILHCDSELLTTVCIHVHAIHNIDRSPSLAKLRLLRCCGGKINIIKRLAPNWKGLGDLLDFDVDGTQLRIIEKRYSNDPEECCRAMFQYWLAGNGVKCSWSSLIELLKDCDEEVLAKDIEAALNK